MKNRQIKNSCAPKNNVKNLIDVSQKDALEQYLRSNLSITFDFSALKCFNSCKVNQFNNFLTGDKDFIGKMKQTFELVQKLSSKSVAELFDASNNYRHCHEISGEKETVVHNILEKLYPDSQYILQNYDGETFYQAGLEKDVRLIGIITGNIFKVLIIDYFHDLYSDEKKNIRSGKTHGYSVNF